HVIRSETRFAGLRRPIKGRDELIPRMAEVKAACKGVINGPLTHILRFDSEIGYPVAAEVNDGEVKTHTLRRLDFFSLLHKGPLNTLRNSTQKVFAHMQKAGLASELEIMEVYHRFDPENQDDNLIETRVSFLAWPEIYWQQLLPVLGPELSAEIWAGGEAITPFTLVDERAAWVAQSLASLKKNSNPEQQFDILSRVALVRPVEDTNKHKQLYAESRDVNAILAAQNEQLKAGPTGGFIDPPRFDGKILHLSKVAANRAAYDQARTQDERRRAYCFCALISAAQDPQVDPIFCYRAAGWARQFWEPILETTFKTCTITHSILKGDAFCAWDYVLEEGWDQNMR
ncbi:MAG: hypothetical protein MUO62_19855, partial [Anaerolineales bacterium]|nr:hypothetical protein [Anaerolineales bacterium]